MNVFIVHGSYGKPFENWFPWMEKELEKKDISCVIPTFPTPAHQNYDAWSELLDYYVEKGFITSETVMVGHSCGAVFISKYLNQNNLSVKALITVAGYNHFYSNNHMDDLNGSFYFNEGDAASLRANIPVRISYYADNDPFIPQEKLVEFVCLIDAKAVLVKNAGHFNASAGYNEFQLLLDQILSL